MLLKEKKKEENVQLDVSVERTIITIVFKDIHEMHKDFAFQFLFADLIYGKILNLGNQWTVEFLCWKFYEWNISCLFFFNCQDILSFFITFLTVFKSLQLLSLFALKCREKKVFVWFSIYYAIGIPRLNKLAGNG